MVTWKTDRILQRVRCCRHIRNIKPSELSHAYKSLSNAVKVPQRAWLVSQRQMAWVGVTRVHPASFVRLLNQGEVRLRGAEIVVMIAAAQLSLSSVASTKPILLDLNRIWPRVSCCYLSLHNISASSWVINCCCCCC